LNTGNFRVQPEDLNQFKLLLTVEEGCYVVKRISSLYLDTTFASKNYYEFSARKDSYANLIKLIENKNVDNKRCL